VTPNGDTDPAVEAVVDGPVVEFADEVVVVVVAADLLDELHAPNTATHATNTRTVLQERRTADPTDMNSSSSLTASAYTRHDRATLDVSFGIILTNRSDPSARTAAREPYWRPPQRREQTPARKSVTAKIRTPSYYIDGASRM